MIDNKNKKKAVSSGDGNVMTMEEIEDRIRKMDGVTSDAAAELRPTGNSVEDDGATKDAKADVVGGTDDSTDLQSTEAKAKTAAPATPSAYEQVWKMLNPYKMPTGEELERERRRERREMAVRAIGDGLSALAGMAGAMAGGRNTVNHELSLSKKGMELRDKLLKERETMRDQYVKHALSAARVDAETARTKAMEAKAQQQADLARYKAENSIMLAQEKLALAKSKEEFDQKKDDALLALKERELDLRAEKDAGMLSVAKFNAETQRIKAQSDRIRAMKYQSGGSGRSGGSSGSGKAPKETATDWMYRIQDEDPDGYEEAVKGALGYYVNYPTSAQAGRIRSYYNNKINKPKTNKTSTTPRTRQSSTPPKGGNSGGGRGGNSSAKSQINIFK